MHLGYISRWKANYTFSDMGQVFMNLTSIDPVGEARRLTRILKEDAKTKPDKIELADTIKMLEWAASCPLRQPSGRKEDARYTIRMQKWEHVLANLDIIDLPVVATNLTGEEVHHFATETNDLKWVPQRGWLFGGYYRDKEGTCYYPC